MTYSIQTARKEAFEHFHEALNTPERLEKLVRTLDSLLDTGSMRLQAFTVGVLIDVLFQGDEEGCIKRFQRINQEYLEKLRQMIQEAMADPDESKPSENTPE